MKLVYLASFAISFAVSYQFFKKKKVTSISIQKLEEAIAADQARKAY